MNKLLYSFLLMLCSTLYAFGQQETWVIRFIDENSLPISGVQATILKQQSALSNVFGEITFKGDQHKSYTIVAKKEGFQTTQQDIQLNIFNRTIELVLVPSRAQQKEENTITQTRFRRAKTQQITLK